MNRFKVWLRPAATDCKIRVEGVENAKWLRGTLEQKGVASTPSMPVKGTNQVSFHATYPPQLSHMHLQHFIERLPQVELMLDPA